MTAQRPPEARPVANPINRYALGDRSNMTFAEDGSLTIYIQSDAISMRGALHVRLKIEDMPRSTRTEETKRFPNITYNPTIQGGSTVLAGTRLPVRTVAVYWRETHDRKRVLRNYPQLTPELLAEAIHYYEAHHAEIDAELLADDDAETG